VATAALADNGGTMRIPLRAVIGSASQ